MSTRTSLVLAALATVVIGCGDTTIDGAKLEDEIVDDARQRGLVLDGADCPSPDAARGSEFECTVTVKGDETELTVVQRDDEGNVDYDLGALLGGVPADEAAIRFVVEAVNADPTALCDYATRAYRTKLKRRSRKSCPQTALADHGDPIEDYEVSVDGDTAAVAGSGSDRRRAATLERVRDGSWLIARFE